MIPDAAMDAALDFVADADEWHMCAGAPADYADLANHTLGHVHVDSGDFTKANGDTSGRKLTIGAQSITATGDGTVDTMVLIDSVAEAIRATVTTANKAVLTSDVVPIEACDIWEIRDPA